MQETELDRFQAPEDAAAEEDKLRAEREAKEKQQIKVRIAGACAAGLLCIISPKELAIASAKCSSHDSCMCLAKLIVLQVLLQA